ncbi:hypothetical protein Tco_0080575 [Tanacetum coccineum]
MMARDKERLEMTLANVHVMMADRLGWYDMDERSNDAIDVLKTYGTTQPPGLQDPSNDPYFGSLLIMPPLRRLGASRTRGSRRAAMERMIADRVAQAIEDHEKK